MKRKRNRKKKRVCEKRRVCVFGWSHQIYVASLNHIQTHTHTLSLSLSLIVIIIIIIIISSSLAIHSFPYAFLTSHSRARPCLSLFLFLSISLVLLTRISFFPSENTVSAALSPEDAANVEKTEQEPSLLALVEVSEWVGMCVCVCVWVCGGGCMCVWVCEKTEQEPWSRWAGVCVCGWVGVCVSGENRASAFAASWSRWERKRERERERERKKERKRERERVCVCVSVCVLCVRDIKRTSAWENKIIWMIYQEDGPWMRCVHFRGHLKAWKREGSLNNNKYIWNCVLAANRISFSFQK